MARYKVGHNYAASRDGRRLAFTKGEVVEVDDNDASFVEVDSPGALVAVDGDEPTVIEGVAVESETAGTGEAVNAETGEVTAPGEPLPVVEPAAEAPVEDVKARGGLLRGKRSGGSR